jgi:hypothetical protein
MKKKTLTIGKLVLALALAFGAWGMELNSFEFTTSDAQNNVTVLANCTPDGGCQNCQNTATQSSCYQRAQLEGKTGLLRAQTDYDALVRAEEERKYREAMKSGNKEKMLEACKSEHGGQASSWCEGVAKLEDPKYAECLMKNSNSQEGIDRCHQSFARSGFTGCIDGIDPISGAPNPDIMCKTGMGIAKGSQMVSYGLEAVAVMKTLNSGKDIAAEVLSKNEDGTFNQKAAYEFARDEAQRQADGHKKRAVMNVGMGAATIGTSMAHWQTQNDGLRGEAQQIGADLLMKAIQGAQQYKNAKDQARRNQWAIDQLDTLEGPAVDMTNTPPGTDGGGGDDGAGPPATPGGGGGIPPIAGGGDPGVIDDLGGSGDGFAFGNEDNEPHGGGEIAGTPPPGAGTTEYSDAGAGGGGGGAMGGGLGGSGFGANGAEGSGDPNSGLDTLDNLYASDEGGAGAGGGDGSGGGAGGGSAGGVGAGLGNLLGKLFGGEEEKRDLAGNLMDLGLPKEVGSDENSIAMDDVSLFHRVHVKYVEKHKVGELKI